MKKQTTLKALVLSLAVAVGMLLPMTTNAQKSDGFFRGGYDSYENRATIDDDGEMGHWGIGQTVPVGSGLLILTTIGAGYAISRRKRSRRDASNVSKYGTLLLAFALILGMTNCKKKLETIQSVAENGGVQITLDVEGDNSKVIVDPTGSSTYATVAFETGDIIYVGYNNAYVGYLTYNSETGKFSGGVNIDAPVGEQPLHFYFLGGTGVQPDPSAVSNNELSVVISDQTSKYPVVSYAHSKQIYAGEGKYSAKLVSKCSIIKFNVTTPSTSPICITGMNNKVTVNFGTNAFSYDKEGDGVIKMKGVASSGGATWAIVLQQGELAVGAAGTAYTADFSYSGARAAIPEITMNQYLNEDRAMTVNTVVWDGDLAKITNSSTEAFATARDGMTIYGTLGVQKKVSIADGATVTLNGISINSDEAWADGGFAGLTCLGDATIIIADGTTNVVRGIDRAYPAIHVPSSKTLTIQGATGKTGKLFAYINGPEAAGIGGGRYLNCGNIFIESGNVTATGSAYAAAIGGGHGASCGYITISTGVSNVTAINVDDGPCIGAGEDGTCGTITIGGNTTGTISTRYYTYPETAMHLFDIEGSLIYYIPGDSWEDAAAYEENAFYIFNDEKVMINIDNEEKKLKCNDEDVAPDATINPNASYSWGTNTGGDLTSINIEGFDIWFSVGETWEYAINNHDNSGWEIVEGDVSYNGLPLLDWSNDHIHSWDYIESDPNIYHFDWGPDK